MTLSRKGSRKGLEGLPSSSSLSVETRAPVMPRTRSRILPIGYESEPRSAFADEPLHGERWGYEEPLHSWYWGLFAEEHLVKSAVLCG